MGFRPAKRTLSSGMQTKEIEDWMDGMMRSATDSVPQNDASLELSENAKARVIRSSALGRLNFRPAKRSLALGRNRFRPAKRSIDGSCAALADIEERLLELLQSVGLAYWTLRSQYSFYGIMDSVHLCYQIQCWSIVQLFLLEAILP
ncbi:unnamed protein product [Gongylonema pulchrum]|uniref:PH domain-containing protein n=1 Tax=Gongylonema pulchrum TaxID=637853 RepID=A0A183CWW2_9BILA|nr:unnamed protein product [Gongylonema pulchrum]